MATITFYEGKKGRRVNERISYFLGPGHFLGPGLLIPGPLDPGPLVPGPLVPDIKTNLAIDIQH